MNYLGVKRPGREADQSPPSSAEVKNAWSYTSAPPIRLHGVVLGWAQGLYVLPFIFKNCYHNSRRVGYRVMLLGRYLASLRWIFHMDITVLLYYLQTIFLHSCNMNWETWDKYLYSMSIEFSVLFIQSCSQLSPRYVSLLILWLCMCWFICFQRWSIISEAETDDEKMIERTEHRFKWTGKGKPHLTVW
jgi:hypothetical protein